MLGLLRSCRIPLIVCRSGLSRGQNCRYHSSKRKDPSRSANLADEGVQLPRSLDIYEEQQKVDVEKYFPDAIRHLRATAMNENVQLDRQQREWYDEVHNVNVDGLPRKENAKAMDNLFAQKSFPIKQNAKNRVYSFGSTPKASGSASPDILGLTGGSLHEHAGSVDEVSNSAPADCTLEGIDDVRGSDKGSGFGDTPVELTDMLRERMMELKTQKLQEDRYTGYLPKRLNLASDAEVQLALHRSSRQKRKDASSVSVSPSTLADLSSDPERESQLHTNLIGVEDLGQLKAAEYLRNSKAPIPGESRTTQPKRDAHFMDNEEEVNDAVYLLRTLPRAGFCSRREAEDIIASGQVRVNNVVERNPFRWVQAHDDIHVEGHQSRLRFAPPRLWMYHKPSHVIASRNDVAGRSLISKHATILGIDHLIPVGSLPMRSHGVLLLTNDGELSRFLEDPRSMIQQTYMLRVRPAIDPLLAHRFNTKGITVDGKQIRGVEFVVNPSMKSRFSVKVKVRGDTIPIHQLMKHIGRTVERGGRIAVGPFSLHSLAVGSIREVTVPPYYTNRTGRVWKTFIERDWPFFRRQRIIKLRKLSRYRELRPKEIEELENATYHEIQETLALESAEFSSLEPDYPCAQRPEVDVAPIAPLFSSVPGAYSESETNINDIIADITDTEAVG